MGKIPGDKTSIFFKRNLLSYRIPKLHADVLSFGYIVVICQNIKTSSATRGVIWPDVCLFILSDDKDMIYRKVSLVSALNLPQTIFILMRIK